MKKTIRFKVSRSRRSTVLKNIHKMWGSFGNCFGDTYIVDSFAIRSSGHVVIRLLDDCPWFWSMSPDKCLNLKYKFKRLRRKMQ